MSKVKGASMTVLVKKFNSATNSNDDYIIKHGHMIHKNVETARSPYANDSILNSALQHIYTMPFFIIVPPINAQHEESNYIHIPWIIVAHPWAPLESWSPIAIQRRKQIFTAILGPVHQVERNYLIYNLYHDYDFLPAFVAVPLHDSLHPPYTPYLISSAYYGVLDFTIM
jgi:hypothetical protein